MKTTIIKAVDIPDAWFQCVSALIDKGHKYTIEKGSNEGHTRLEFDFAVIEIEKPYQEPYDLMLPEIPAHLNIPNPVAAGYVEQYMPYLMTGQKQEGEDYTYGERLVQAECVIDLSWLCINQIERWIKVLKKTPNTNQAILQVGQPGDCMLIDPPCLRHIDMRVKTEWESVNGIDGLISRLHFYPYFRSWDLWGGFPANLAGIAVLQKYMADAIGVDMGGMIASSKGLHIYGYAEEIAKIRTGKQGGSW